MDTRKKNGAGRIEDRRGQHKPIGRIPPPKMPFLSYLQKLIWNPPWMSGEVLGPGDLPGTFPRVLPLRFLKKMSDAELAAISKAYRANVAGMRLSPPPRRFGR